MGALFLHLKPDEYLKKLYKTKKLVEKTSFSLQADPLESAGFFIFSYTLRMLLINLHINFFHELRAVYNLSFVFSISSSSGKI
ncbi:hypothetical protein NRS6120_05240 [Bacillus subtilis]|nr:hypothetical protein NRS6120_04190 [Bacillus subtilis]CAI6242663.1 hypothetical protein NRS6120_05240 [Bacillus subtilis]